MEYITKDILPIVISIVAAIVAIFAIINSRSLFKRNIKIEKLERVISLLNKLVMYYKPLFGLYGKLNLYHSRPIFQSKDLVAYQDSLKMFLQTTDDKSLTESYYEFEMLVNTYTDGKLKLELLAFCRLYLDIMFVSLQSEYIIKESNWKTGFPHPHKIAAYYKVLERKLIKEIGLSSNTSMFSNDKVRGFCTNKLIGRIEKANKI